MFVFVRDKCAVIGVNNSSASEYLLELLEVNEDLNEDGGCFVFSFRLWKK